MIYLKQDYKLDPASPANMDAFVELANETLIPSYERLGARLLAAWFGNSEWFYQVSHLVEFSDLASFDAWRQQARADAEWQDCEGRIHELAPERRDTLLEPAGPVSPEVIHRAIDASQESPSEVYSFASLHALPGKLEDFKALLAASASRLPIIAALSPVAGEPNLVIDIWKGDVQRGYSPNSPGMDAFFGPLRKIAPRETVATYFPLPYSPLK